MNIVSPNSVTAKVALLVTSWMCNHKSFQPHGNDLGKFSSISCDVKECDKCAAKSQLKPTATEKINDSITPKRQPNITMTPVTERTTNAICIAADDAATKRLDITNNIIIANNTDSPAACIAPSVIDFCSE